MTEHETEDLLEVKGLEAVDVHKSMNKTVQRIWDAVRKYNLLVKRGSNRRAEQAQLLQEVMYFTTLYLTSKPPGTDKARVAARWEALLDLTRQASKQAETLKTKLLHGGNFQPGVVMDDDRNGTDLAGPWGAMEHVGRSITMMDDDWQERSSSWWLEVVDPDHRHGMELTSAFRAWCGDRTARDEKRSFWDYTSTRLPAESATYLKIAANGVHFHDGKLVDSADELVHAGKGDVAVPLIFVCDQDWNLYVREGKNGVFHHGSFHAGQPVRCAGGMIVGSGVILEVNANSGHYRTTPALLQEFVKHFWQIPNRAVIIPNTATGKEYACGLYRKYGEDSRALLGAPQEKPERPPGKTAAIVKALERMNEKLPALPTAPHAQEPAKVNA